MSEKPHLGRIKNWVRVDTVRGPVIYGEFLDHPWLREGHTSPVINQDEATGEIETKNSRYKLVDKGEPSPLAGWPNKGDIYIFRGESGYDHERKEAHGRFQVGKEYEVEDCEIGNWHHTIKFVGIAGRYNGVMFKKKGE